MKAIVMTIVLATLAIGSAEAADGARIALPPRAAAGGMDVVTALEQRQTTREFAPTGLTMADISALLWAANGVNRPDGRRTAPTAMNRQYIDIYVVGEGGLIFHHP